MTAIASPQIAAQPRPVRAGLFAEPYLVGPIYDWLFFLLPPSLSLLAGIVVAASATLKAELVVGRETTTLSSFALGAIVHAHLVAVVFRSHANPTILRRHPVRFAVVPVALFALLAGNDWAAAASVVVATAWDVWHSGAQTFGFARLYEARAGIAETTRRLDFALNQVLYAGPILAGVSLAAHLYELDAFEPIDHPLAAMLTTLPVRVLSHRGPITWIVVSLGLLVVALYVAANLRLSRRGVPISRRKIFLLASTGACSLVTWGFDPFGEAFLVMNLFHAVQYLALVWAKEGNRLVHRVGLPTTRLGKSIALAGFLAGVFAYGIGVEALDPGLRVAWAATMVVSLMHFWYDGFVWNVRDTVQRVSA